MQSGMASTPPAASCVRESFGPGSYGAPAFILSLAALCGHPSLARLSLCVLSSACCTGPWVVRPSLHRSGGHTFPKGLQLPLCSVHRLLRCTGFYHRVGAPTTPTVRDSDPLSWIETFGTFCGMVGLQAMVLGRLGRKPSLIQEHVLYPAHRHLRAGAPTIPPRVRGSGPSLCPSHNGGA